MNIEATLCASWEKEKSRDKNLTKMELCCSSEKYFSANDFSTLLQKLTLWSSQFQIWKLYDWTAFEDIEFG